MRENLDLDKKIISSKTEGVKGIIKTVDKLKNFIVEEMADTYDGKIKIAKMNVDENPSTPGKYGVRGIPTLILFKKGEVVDQVVGAVPKSQVKGLIEKAVG